MKDKIIIGACVLAVGVGMWQVFSSKMVLGGGFVESGVRMVDIETGHKFKIEIGKDFAGWPVKSHDTGRMTGYPAEACYWNDCGQEKEGTWVVLNETLGKDGPTTCTKCGRLVVGHNPLPPGTYVNPEGFLQKRQRQSYSSEGE